MKLLNPMRLVLVATIVLAGLFSAGMAQTIPDTSDSVPALTTGLARKNADGSSVTTRMPGKMVNAGIAKLQAVAPSPPAVITATAQPGLYDLFVAGAVDLLLKAIEDLLAYFQNLFLARAGLPPSDSNTNDNTNDNTNSNVNDNTNDNTSENTNDNTNSNNNGNDNTSTIRPPQTGVRKQGSATRQSSGG